VHAPKPTRSLADEVEDRSVFGSSGALAARQYPALEGSDDELNGGPRRILIYSHSLPPWVDGVSTRFKAHLRLLQEAGHECHVVTIEEALCKDVRASCASVTTVDATCLYWYPAKRFPDLTLCNLARVWRACVASRAQVLHVTMCPSLPLFFICARALNIPLMVSVHTDTVTLLDKCQQPAWCVAAVKCLEPLGTWFADATYTVSPSYSAILRQRGIRCLGVTWGGYANPAVFHPGRRGEGQAAAGGWRNVLSFNHPNDFILITAGRVSPEKDIGFLVELVRRARAGGLKVRLAIIGDGPAASEFAPLHGLESSGVWFVPRFLKQTELAEVYASVDCVCSASTFETFGFTSLEAMACGTPFLGPRAQGFRDVVQHNKGGYLFDARDLTSASHYLELLVKERHELFPPEEVLASTADFTAAACVARTLAAYQLTRGVRQARAAAWGCSRTSGRGGGGHHSVRRAVRCCLRTLPAFGMVVFMAVNWGLLNAPLWWCACHRTLLRLRRTCGATWDRRMRFTNLTRNRVLVGSQVTS
jgi:glycosyltransferase involved in cell wall biosynthesis